MNDLFTDLVNGIQNAALCRKNAVRSKEHTNFRTLRWGSPHGVCRESSLHHWEESYNVPGETLLLLVNQAVILRIKYTNYRSMSQRRSLLTHRSFSVRNCGSYDLCIRCSIEQGIITVMAPTISSAVILWNLQFTLQQWAST